ncbi:MAG: transcription antitermination factor NusB [Clostridia bacterium]|nr:transcription antitermination factor NusB [Clostridia bacterium]
MTRKQGREYGFKFIFEYEVQREDSLELLSQFFDLNPDIEDQKEYIEKLADMVISNITQIDMLISENSKTRTHERISRVSLAALRVGLAEMLYSDLYDSIAISEAVRIAKKYEGEKASAFVNGILSTVYKKSGGKNE